ncbi:hypothetical protein AGR4B_pAt20461 [Agrobacterium tumefaciens str. CFBP 5621]|nr:hypothetical protein AGR4B_pAt20461 [Agrobacterium tumefaciens str. CFBP 5621]
MTARRKRLVCAPTVQTIEISQGIEEFSDRQWKIYPCAQMALDKTIIKRKSCRPRIAVIVPI